MVALREMCSELVSCPGVIHDYILKETLHEVEGRWNDLTELLVQQVSLEVSFIQQKLSSNRLSYNLSISCNMS